MTRVVPARARELAARLSALFERDVEIVERLNDAQRGLLCANDRLWPGLAPDAFHRAFCHYQSACEERRQLAFDVGELAAQLTEVLRGAGWSEQAERRADVHELARRAG